MGKTIMDVSRWQGTITSHDATTKFYGTVKTCTFTVV